MPFNVQLPNDRNGDTNFNDRPEGVSFRLTAGVSVEAIVDAFDVLNRANFQVPNNIVTSPTFGRPTAVNDPRQFQFGLRVLF